MDKIVLRVDFATDDGRIAAYAAKALTEGVKGVKAEVCLGDKGGPPWTRVVLDDWRATPLPSIIERLGVASGIFGVEVGSCEILGKFPVGVLVQVAAHYLKMKEITPEQLIFKV